MQLTGELTGEYQRCRSQALTPEVVAELSELVGAIETISKELAARKSQELDETVAALDREVAQAVEEGNSEVPTPAVAQPPPPADLNEQLAALDSRVGAVSDATPPVAQTGWRSWRQRIGPRGQPGGTGNARPAVLFWGGVAGALLGIVLVVLGIVVGFSSGSSDRSSADQARAETQSSQAQEGQAGATRDAISTAITALSNEVKSLTDAGNQLTDAKDAITNAFNNATGLSNAGNVAGAVAGYQSQSAAIADLDTKLKASQDQLAKAQQSLGALQARQSQP